MKILKRSWIRNTLTISAWKRRLTLLSSIEHRDLLATKPKFDWRSIVEGAGMAGALATSGTLMHQITNTIGNGGFKPNKVALIGAAVMGTLVGGGLNAVKSRQDYKRDVDTQKNIDDAISILVNRSLRKAPYRTDYLARIENSVEDAPLQYGRTMSSIDFANLDKH
jgi:hypothetical protein